MIHNIEPYLAAAELNKEKQQQYLAEQHINIRKRIETQNMQYGYNTIPDEEWFYNGHQIVITTHGCAKGKKLPAFVKPSMHNHDFFEMNYVYKGELYNQVEDSKILEKENTLMILSPKARHVLQTINQPIVFNFLIKRKLVETIFLQIFSESEQVCRFFLDSLYNIHLKQPYLLFECTPEIKELLHMMIEEYFGENSFYQSIITAKLIELFSMLSRNLKNTQKEEMKEHSDEFSINFGKYLEQYYATATLQHAAKYFGYTESSFSRLVQNKFHKNFSVILREVRLKYACRYLTYSSLPIQQVAEITGYEDANYFYRIFKQYVGTSPAKYRKESNPLLGV